MIERGERWEMHRAESFAWLYQRESESVDALITDPPYSSGGFTRGDRSLDPLKKYKQSGAAEYAPSFDGDNRDQRGYLAWATLVLGEAWRVLRETCPACVFTDWRQLPITTDAFQAAGFLWRGIAPWTKLDASRPQLGRFRADAEFVVWGSRGPMPMRADVGVLPGSWACAPVTSSQRVHLTEKPVAIMEAIVRICPPGGLVLDPFAGSGSTGVAALRAGLRFVGVERDPTYFQIACERLRAEEALSTREAQNAGQAPLFPAGGSE